MTNLNLNPEQMAKELQAARRRLAHLESVIDDVVKQKSGWLKRCIAAHAHMVHEIDKEFYRNAPDDAPSDGRFHPRTGKSNERGDQQTAR